MEDQVIFGQGFLPLALDKSISNTSVIKVTKRSIQETFTDGRKVISVGTFKFPISCEQPTEEITSIV